MLMWQLKFCALWCSTFYPTCCGRTFLFSFIFCLLRILLPKWNRHVKSKLKQHLRNLQSISLLQILLHLHLLSLSLYLLSSRLSQLYLSAFKKSLSLRWNEMCESQSYEILRNVLSRETESRQKPVSGNSFTFFYFYHLPSSDLLMR